MTCIEVTTRKGYCIPMKGKKTEVVLDAWQLLKDETREAGMEIRILTTDLGSEWISDAFDEVLVRNPPFPCSGRGSSQDGDD